MQEFNFPFPSDAFNTSFSSQSQGIQSPQATYNSFPPPKSDSLLPTAISSQVRQSMITDKDHYFENKAIEEQLRVPTFRQISSHTSDSYVWTYRTTGCDVISIITSTLEMKDGQMKDIKVDSLMEVKRLKPPVSKQSNRDHFTNSPYEFGLALDASKQKKILHNQLHNERKEFMKKLSASRTSRGHQENQAALLIQSLYRGYLTRLRYPLPLLKAHFKFQQQQQLILQYQQQLDIINQSVSAGDLAGTLSHPSEQLEGSTPPPTTPSLYALLTHPTIRLNLKSFLNQQGYPTHSLGEWRGLRSSLIELSALKIQAVCRGYIGRKYRDRVRFQQQIVRKRTAAVCIQSMIRGIHDRQRVRILKTRKNNIDLYTKVLLIQKTVRQWLAARKVTRRRFKLQWVAASMIQNWYRAKYSRRMAQHIKAMMLFQRETKGVTFMQKIVRGFLARAFLRKLKYRWLVKLCHVSAIILQKTVRRRLARVHVKKLRADIAQKKLDELKESALEAQTIEQNRLAQEAKQLMQSIDPFIQASQGNFITVDDILSGDSNGTYSSPSAVDSEGNSLLCLACAQGNQEMVHKCLTKYGFDINHVNNHGLSPVLIAAKEGHHDVVSYLLSFLPERVDDENDPDEKSVASLEKAAETEAEAAAKPHAQTQQGASPITLELSSEYMGLLITYIIRYCPPIGLLQTLFAKGVDPNTPSAELGMTGLHAACSTSNLEVVKLLIRNRAKLTVLDENQKSLVHYAASSTVDQSKNTTFQIMQCLLGLDPNFPTYMNDATRLESIKAKDSDGKNTLIHAALAGNNDVVDLIVKIIAGNGSVSATAPLAKSFSKLITDETEDEIAWSSADIQACFQLVRNKNIYCLQHVLSAGLSPEWPDEASSSTLVQIACQTGLSSALDMILIIGGDFSMKDSRGHNILHYAIMGQTSPVSTPLPEGVLSPNDVITYLLTHPKAAACNIDYKLLLDVDAEDNNIFHLAAMRGVVLNIDLLVGSDNIGRLMDAQNARGFTPLHEACRHYHSPLIHQYIVNFGASPAHTDPEGHDALWHLYHPHESSLKGFNFPNISSSSSVGSVGSTGSASTMGSSNISSSQLVASPNTPIRRVFCSEYHVLTAPTRGLLISRKDRDEDAERVKSDIAIVILLLNSGCRLYPPTHHSEVQPEDLLRVSFKKNEVPLFHPHSTFIGDIMVQEMCAGLFKAIVPTMLGFQDLFRLLVASIHYDDGTLRIFHNFLRNGIVDAIIGSSGMSLDSPPPSATIDDLVNNAVKLFSSASSSASGPDTTSSKRARPSVTVAPSPSAISRDSIALTRASTINSLYSATDSTNYTFSAQKLAGLFYADINILGWTIRLKNAKAFLHILKKGNYQSLSTPLDRAGNYSPLHYLAYYATTSSTIEMIDTLLGDKKFDYDSQNAFGLTPLMIAIRNKNHKLCKRLIKGYHFTVFTSFWGVSDNYTQPVNPYAPCPIDDLKNPGFQSWIYAFYLKQVEASPDKDKPKVKSRKSDKRIEQNEFWRLPKILNLYDI